MRKEITLLCLTGVLFFSCSACSVYNVTAGMGEGEHYDAVISVKGREESSTEEMTAQTDRDRAQLEVLMELFGKKDEQAANMLDGGSENRTADGSWLVGRIYQAQLFDETCSVYTSYDEKGEVFLVLAQMTGAEAEKYLSGMEDMTGTQGKLQEDEEGDRRWQWEYGDYLITLYDTKGHMSLDIISISL